MQAQAQARTQARPQGALRPQAGAVPPPPVRPLAERGLDLLVWGGLLLLLVASFGPVEIAKLPQLVTNGASMQQFGRAFLKPDFGDLGLHRLAGVLSVPTRVSPELGRYVGEMWLTVQIALWGTAVAIVIAVPFGLACARNLSPPWLQQPMRILMNILRSVPDLVVGTVFVVAVGLGPFAGVMALALNTGGVLAKLFSEAVESIDPRPVEGVRATGAARMHEIVWGVLPQVAPLWTSYALYRFESNARSATVLGLIGAGGIGQLLFESINAFAYGQTAAIAIVIVVAVTAIDLLSQALRARLM